MGNICLKGISLGVLACIVGGVIGGVVLGLVLSLFYERLSADQIFVPSLIVMLPVLIFSGYLAALVSQKGIYLNAAIVGVIGVTIEYFVPLEVTPLMDVVRFLLPVPAALFGAWLLTLHKRRYQHA